MLLQGGDAPSAPRIRDINAAFQVLPQPLDRVQLRAVRGQPPEDDVLWDRHTLGHVRRGLVQQNDVQTLCIGLTKLAKKDAEARGIQVRQLPSEGLSSGGFDRR